MLTTDNGFDANYGENPSDALFLWEKKVQAHVSGRQFEGILGTFQIYCRSELLFNFGTTFLVMSLIVSSCRTELK